MEPDEIGVVLARASELHSKISDAMERSMKSDFLLSTGARSQNNRESDNGLSVGPDGGYVGKEMYRNREGRHVESANNDTGTVVGDGTTEARSLGAIRDALEVLEDQLESLQAVQQQQRTEKDATLAELEESRRILLNRLREHRGREWEVVHEALAFAGEPVEDRDDLPLPPYPMPLLDLAVGTDGEDPVPPYNGASYLKHNGRSGKLSNQNGEDAEIGPGDGSEEDQEESISYRVEHHKSRVGFFGIPLAFAKACLAQAYGMTTKAAIVAVSVAVTLAVSEFKQRQENINSGKKSAHPGLTGAPHMLRPMPIHGECAPGKKLIMEDGHTKCVVKERVELPFPREIKTPDVLYGRG